MSTVLSELVDMIRSAFPEKTVVDISEYENEEHQTYKYLYELQSEKLKELTEENFDLQFTIQDYEREMADLRESLAVQKSVNEKLSNTTTNIMEFIESFSEQEIFVTDIKVFDKNDAEISVNKDLKVSLIDSISERPGVYGFKRPSWFTPLKNEFTKSNVAKNAASNTKGILKDKLFFWKKIFKDIENGSITAEAAQAQVDQERKNQIIELLKVNASNYEKYLKYFLLTPGLPKHYVNTLVGAAELGLDANVIIELLEQPKELFNKEIIEIYVSETHKGTEYNLKKELAYELIRGDWYVKADINGKSQKFQMAPIELLESINEKLSNISSILSQMADEQLCAKLTQGPSAVDDLAQSCSDFHKNDNDFIGSSDEIPSFIDFDDSVLMNP